MYSEKLHHAQGFLSPLWCTSGQFSSHMHENLAFSGWKKDITFGILALGPFNRLSARLWADGPLLTGDVLQVLDSVVGLQICKTNKQCPGLCQLVLDLDHRLDGSLQVLANSSVPPMIPPCGPSLACAAVLSDCPTADCSVSPWSEVKGLLSLSHPLPSRLSFLRQCCCHLFFLKKQFPSFV